MGQVRFEMKKVIDGKTFYFIGEKKEDVEVKCNSEEKYFVPLCVVVDSCWRYSPTKLLNSVLNKHGQAYEGIVSFAYYDDYPDELEPGVTVDYLDETITINEEFFQHFVMEFAHFYIEARKEFKLGPCDIEVELASLLTALRRKNE